MGYTIGKYEIMEKLGSGAMGDVFKGRDPKTNQVVAIKILSEELCSNPRAVERFKREIVQTIRLNHPNLITAYSAGEFKGRLYYAMEFIEGITAKKELLTRGPYDEIRMIEIMVQMANALEYAAKLGIIHRDIKPDNIMITYDGKAKLCDMGLAKSTESTGPKLTLLGTVLGTPHYMSPEQAQGDENLDTRSDIFSLGSTCYHLLTGSPPFEGTDPITIMTALAEKDPVPMQDRNPKISDDLCAITSKMMAREKEKRYQNFSQLLEYLYKLKRKEKTGALSEGFGPTTSSRKKKFRECYVPSELDLILAHIAMHNKLATIEKLEECLVRQETLALTGITLDLSDVLLEQGVINVQQKGILDKAKINFMLDRGDQLFLKACEGAQLSPQESQIVQQARKNQKKGLGAILLQEGILKEEKRFSLIASLRHSMNAEESKAVLKVALDFELVSQQQAEKCHRIYSNNVVMGKYKPIEHILLEKGFIGVDAVPALVRAVRRNILTKKNSLQYLQETVTTE